MGADGEAALLRLTVCTAGEHRAAPLAASRPPPTWWEKQSLGLAPADQRLGCGGQRGGRSRALRTPCPPTPPPHSPWLSLGPGLRDKCAASFRFDGSLVGNCARSCFIGYRDIISWHLPAPCHFLKGT